MTPLSTIADKPRIIATLGDTAGVGPEILTAAAQHHLVAIIGPESYRTRFPAGTPWLATPERGPVTPGEPSAVSARIAYDCLERATQLATEGALDALVTAPVSKAGLYPLGFRWPGQTEYLAHRAGVADFAMMLAGPSLRTVPVTIHVPLCEVSRHLTPALLAQRLRVTHAGLIRDFGIAAPRIAVAGLNPHAGEGGALGQEEQSVIAPVLETLRAEGMTLLGPMSADTLFHAAARSRYDAAVCMYHDQALIPIKTLDFDQGVNMTLGLPYVRTSPDHGTAFDIAGRGLARPDAMLAAVRLAVACAERRA